MASTNFPTVRHRVMDVLYADRSIIRGTATGGAVNTVIDSSAALPGATTDHFDYSFIKITSTTDGAAPQGEVRAVSEGGYTVATGTWAPAVNFTAAVGSGDTYEIHYGPHPVWLDRLINKYARNFHYKTFWPLSLHIVTTSGGSQDDNDMEYADATPWAATNSTVTKTTSWAFNGRQSLELTATSANGRVSPDVNLQVHPSKQYCAAVMGSVVDKAADIGQFVVYDVTNSADLESSAQITESTWVELVLPFTTTSSTTEITSRFFSIGNSDVTNWDDYQVWVPDGGIYPLPSWITRKEQINDVVVFPQGTSSVGGDSDYRSNEQRSRSVSWRFEREDYGANEEIHIWVPSIGYSRPYVIAERPVAEVSFDYGSAGTGTTANTIPLDSQTTDLLVSGVLSEAFRELASKSSDGAYYREQAAYHAGIWDKGMAELKPRSRRIESNRVWVRM